MSSIYGSIYRFLLGTYINQSARTVVEKTSQKVQYEVFDQYKQKYIRKLGNRYTYRYKIFDVTTTEERTNLLSLLLSLNGTRQTFQPFYDTDYSASVYCDVIFNELTYFPQSFMDLTLTFVDVDTNPAIAPNTITVTAPNGGESYAIGEAVNITWSSYNITGNVDIELWKAGVFYDTIVSDTDNDGAYAWTIDTDYSAGADYQIKIRDTNTGLLSGFSDANFSIDYDGYYLSDGSNDNVIPKSKINLTDLWSICFTINLNGSSVGTKAVIKSTGGTTGLAIYCNNTYAGLVAVQMGGNAIYSSAGKLAANAFTKVCIIVNKVAGTYKIYFDGVEDTGVRIAGSIPTLNYTSLNILNANSDAWKVKQFVFTNTNITAAEIALYNNYQCGSIAGLLAWYKCNEADTGAPYTDKALDSSGNGNHGTPVNITGATFFNQTGTGSHIAGSETFISQSLQPSLCPDSIMPKVVFGAYEYTFDNIQLEYEKRNMIDWEAESITGRLHRRYLTDASGNIRQESAIKITMFDISDSDYTELSRFDRQIVEYYPHASDGSSLYLAHFSVEWLTDTFDFAEITIEPIGNLTSMSLSITAPNGTESYKAGTEQNITWTSTGLLSTSNVKLELFKNSVLDSVIIASTPNDGSYLWTIPYAQTVGTDYKVKISSITYTSVTDLSDANFAVTTPDLNTAGQGNATNIYIDSGIKANTITAFEIDFVWQDLVSGYDGIFGSLDTSIYPSKILRIIRSNTYTTVSMGASGNSISYTNAVTFTNGNKYRISISISAGNYTVVLTDLNSNITLRTDTGTVGTLPDYNVFIFANNNAGSSIINYTALKIIRFKINTEEWNFSVGSGTSITGSLGTVLNIAGTLTNFWTTA
jgi:hypothetical protein